MPKPKLLDIPIDNIKATFEVLKVINGKQLVPLWELAKELGVNKVPLYIFMSENPSLFIIGEYIKTKEHRTRNDSLTESLTNEAYNVTTSQENKGIHVYDIFLTAKDNPTHPDYLQHKIDTHKKYIHITPWQHPEEGRNYLIIQPDSRFANQDIVNKFSKWRNTKEKIAELKTLIKLIPAMFHGQRDTYEVDGAYRLMPGDITRIKRLGWTTNMDEPVEQ